MATKKPKSSDGNKNSMDSAVARVIGAVRVASATVAETMAIKNEALEDVEASRTKTNSKEGNLAVKKIGSDSKKILGKK